MNCVNFIVVSVGVLSFLFDLTHGDGTFDTDCSKAIEGFYCRSDLKGYRHCSANGTKTDYECGTGLKCVCQLKTICKVEEGYICQKKEKLNFKPNFLMVLRGKRITTIYGQNETKNMTYETFQNGGGEKRRERIYIGNDRQEVIITKRDEAGNLHQYIQDYKNTSQISCEKHPLSEFVGYERSFDLYTKQEYHQEIISDEKKYPKHRKFEEWALKIGRNAPNEEEIARYLILTTNYFGQKRPYEIIDRRFGSFDNVYFIEGDIFTETDLLVTNYMELPIADAWFRTPMKCDDGHSYKK